MLKIFYLIDRYKDPKFKTSQSIELCLNGVGNTGILIRDRSNELDYKILEIKGMQDYTNEYDSFNTYMINNKDSLLWFLKNHDCKVLYCSEYSKINEKEAIQLLCNSLKK